MLQRMWMCLLPRKRQRNTLSRYKTNDVKQTARLAPTKKTLFYVLIALFGVLSLIILACWQIILSVYFNLLGVTYPFSNREQNKH